MKNSEIAAARARVALIRDRGEEEPPEWLVKIADQEFDQESAADSGEHDSSPANVGAEAAQADVWKRILDQSISRAKTAAWKETSSVSRSARTGLYYSGRRHGRLPRPKHTEPEDAATVVYCLYERNLSIPGVTFGVASPYILPLSELALQVPDDAHDLAEFGGDREGEGSESRRG